LNIADVSVSERSKQIAGAGQRRWGFLAAQPAWEAAETSFYFNELIQHVNGENTCREIATMRTRLLKGLENEHGPAAILQ
jgi:hypothetical protein